MRNEKLITLVEMALAIGLACVLELWKIKLPVALQGGSFSLEMLPIAIVAFRRGGLAGLICGAIYGSIDLLTGDAYIIHWVQLLLDYPLPYALFGLGAGLGSRAFKEKLANDKKVQALGIATGFMIFGVALRYCAHVLSGAIFFAEYAPVGQSAWIYSAVYNISYLLPSAIAVIVCALILLPILEKAVPSHSLFAKKHSVG